MVTFDGCRASEIGVGIVVYGFRAELMRVDAVNTFRVSVGYFTVFRVPKFSVSQFRPIYVGGSIPGSSPENQW